MNDDFAHRWILIAKKLANDETARLVCGEIGGGTDYLIP